MSFRRLSVLTLPGILLALASCGSPYPLEEGTYEFKVLSARDNSCSWLEEEDFGVGESDLLLLSWKDEDTFTLGNGDEDEVSTYELTDDDEVAREDFVTGELEGSCFWRQDMVFEGSITSKTSFETEGTYDFSTEGDCDDAQDASLFPCSARITTRSLLHQE